MNAIVLLKNTIISKEMGKYVVLVLCSLYNN